MRLSPLQPAIISGMAKIVFWTLAAFAVALPFASCYGAMEGVQAALGTYDEWVYEDCEDYADRVPRCRPLDEPRKEERTTAGADIWAGMGAFVVAIWIGVGSLSFLNKRWRVIDDGSEPPISPAPPR